MEHLHWMPFQNRIHSWPQFPKRYHFVHYEWCTVFAFEMGRTIDTMEYHTIRIEFVFSKIPKIDLNLKSWNIILHDFSPTNRKHSISKLYLPFLLHYSPHSIASSFGHSNR